MRNFTTNMLKNLINSSSKKIDKIKVNDLALIVKVKKNSLFFALKGTKVTENL